MFIVRWTCVITALTLCFSTQAAIAESSESMENPLQTVNFLPASDFSESSFILEYKAQSDLLAAVKEYNLIDASNIVATGFSGASESGQSNGLAMQRARSIKAFFILQGFDADNISVNTGEMGTTRPGQLQFEFRSKSN